VRGGALTLAEVSGDVLRIGRGTRASLRSDNPAVSLDHATIAHDAAGYSITDLGSITGTYVNGRPVETARLSKGDVVEIKSKSRQMIVLRHNLDTLDRAVPAWLEVSSGDFRATVRDLPLREQIDVPVREQLIVELYSK